MTSWNPDVPNAKENTPRWGRDSVPITRWEGDQSAGKALEGFNDMLKIAVTGADTVVKDSIDKQTWDRVNTVRDEFTQALDQTAMAADPKRQSMTDQFNPPQGITGRMEYLESLKNGFEAGKVNDTYYKARLTSIAKDLRDQYPGYREYVDKKISSITGFDPANALVSDLLADINTLATNSKKDAVKDKFNALVDDYIKEGVPGAAKLMDKVNKGEATAAEGMQQLEVWAKPKYDAAVAKRNFEAITTNNAMDKLTTERFIDSTMAKDVTHLVNFMQNEGGVASIPEIRDYIGKVRRGEIINDPQKTQAYVQLISDHLDRLQNKWNQSFTNDKTKAGLTAVEIFGQDNLNKKIEASVKPLKDILGYLTADNPTLATYATQQLKARQEVSLQRMLSNPKISDYLLNLHSIEQIAGATATQKVIENHNLTENLGNFNQYFATSAAAAAVQDVKPNPYGPITMKGDVEATRIEGVPVSVSTDQALKNATNLVDPEINDSIKRGFVQYFFHPDNMGNISRFNKESSMKMWNTITSSGFTDEAVRVSRQSPALQKMHQNWVEQAFGTEIFSREIKDFSSLKLPEGVSLSYDTETHQYKLHVGEYAKGSKIASAIAGRTLDSNPPLIKAAEETVNRINQGIKGLANYYKAVGKKDEEVDVEVLNVLSKHGYDPRAGAVTTFPEALIRSTYLAKKGGDLVKKLTEGKD